MKWLLTISILLLSTSSYAQLRGVYHTKWDDGTEWLVLKRGKRYKHVVKEGAYGTVTKARYKVHDDSLLKKRYAFPYSIPAINLDTIENLDDNPCIQQVRKELFNLGWLRLNDSTLMRLDSTERKLYKVNKKLPDNLL